jgi:transcriptional regulator with XRE-family HTH domain
LPLVSPNADPIDVAIGARIRGARLGAGKSQLELASELGVSAHQLQKFEQGKASLPLVVLVRLTQNLKASVADFLPPHDGPVDSLEQLGVSFSGLEEFAAYISVLPERRIALVAALVEDLASSTPGAGGGSALRANDG